MPIMLLTIIAFNCLRNKVQVQLPLVCVTKFVLIYDSSDSLSLEVNTYLCASNLVARWSLGRVDVLS